MKTERSNFSEDLITVLLKLCLLFCKVLYKGFIFSIKLKPLAFLYFIVFIITVILAIFNQNIFYLVSFLLTLWAFFGLLYYKTYIIIINKRKYFNKIFEKINFKSSEGDFPNYLCDFGFKIPKKGGMGLFRSKKEKEQEERRREQRINVELEQRREKERREEERRKQVEENNRTANNFYNKALRIAGVGNVVVKAITTAYGQYESTYDTNFLCKKDINEYLTTLVFNSLIPLSDWQKKQENLETALNMTIDRIEQDENNKQVIKVICTNKPLPSKINFNNSFISNEDILNIGFGCYGIVGYDLSKYPHSFITGDTGSGKSNIMRCLIYQALFKGYEVVLIDFKRGVDFAIFSEHVEIITDEDKALKELENTIDETNQRLDLLRTHRVENINNYNETAEKKLKRKIIFIDELAELLTSNDRTFVKKIYSYIETLLRKSRAPGINLIMGLQRVDSTIITGQMKTNVAFRVCGHFPDPEPSRIILGNDMAMKLPDIKGRFIVKSPAHSYHIIQCFCYDNSFDLSSLKVSPATEKINKNINDIPATKPIETASVKKEIIPTNKTEQNTSINTENSRIFNNFEPE